MARKSMKVDIKTGRDAGKTFVITEMPCSQAEKWAIRAFLAMAQSGVDIPDNIASAGFAGLAQLGFGALSKISFDAAEPLLDELMSCVVIMPNPAAPDVVRGLIEDDIEEISTRFKLRTEVLKLLTGFSIAGDTSTSAQPPA